MNELLEGIVKHREFTFIVSILLVIMVAVYSGYSLLNHGIGSGSKVNAVLEYSSGDQNSSASQTGGNPAKLPNADIIPSLLLLVGSVSGGVILVANRHSHKTNTGTLNLSESAGAMISVDVLMKVLERQSGLGENQLQENVKRSKKDDQAFKKLYEIQKLLRSMQSAVKKSYDGEEGNRISEPDKLQEAINIVDALILERYE
jgi:hypothetical protein